MRRALGRWKEVGLMGWALPSWLVGVLLVLFGLVAPAAAAAEPPSGAADTRLRIGFSNLVARLDNDEIGLAKAELRVHLIEALRGAGYNAVGAESLVFDRDKGELADVLLGGTVRELECRKVSKQTTCRIGIEWELLDREQDVIVYRMLARHIDRNVDPAHGAIAAKRLVLGALQVLLTRPHFRDLLGRKRETVPENENYASAGFMSCSAGPRELPANFDTAASATFIVKQGGGFGTGFSISPDGLVLTAAHVVSGASVQLIRRGDTTPLEATVVRISRRHDVALLALPRNATPQPCLDVAAESPSPGDDVFAIGSPASQDLAFSLTRGIVSGVRALEGVQLVQTDASLNPGNSGGPLLDRHARAVGVVSRKLAGKALEGLGFAVQIQDALLALKLQPEPQTSAMLLPTNASVSTRAETAPFVDTPSPRESLDPEGDRLRAEREDYERRIDAQRRMTPAYVKPMRWLGLATGIAGSLLVAESWMTTRTDTRVTHAEFEARRTRNDVGWLMFGLGTAAFVVSYPLQPKLPPHEAGSRAAVRWSLGVSPGGVILGARL
jgi:S1-C subfamily serine protease